MAHTRRVNRQLGAVEFVRDYVMLKFDGPTLTAYTLPVIHNVDKVIREKDPHYRDALCAQIGKTALNLEIQDTCKFIVDFEDGVKFVISLLEADKIGPEAAMYAESKTKVWVW